MPKLRDPFVGIADPTRRAILELLRDADHLAAGGIAAHFPGVSRVAVAKHVRVLRECGLVVGRPAGREVWYSLDARPLRQVQEDWLMRFAPLWEASLEALRQAVEDAPPPEEDLRPPHSAR